MTSLGLAMLVLTAPADAGKIKIAAVSASSTYPTEEGISYAAKQLIDGKQATSWVEGETGSGLGSWVQLDLGGDKSVKEIKIWAGLWYSYDYHQRANRPKEVEFTFSDGSTEKFMLGDEMKPQVFTLSKAKTTSTIKVKVRAIHNGNTWLDTAISEIQVFDGEAGGPVAVKAFSASSQLPDDDDGSYVPVNVNDGISDSMWCEANKDGDGNGEWIEFDFGGTTSVSQLAIINGIGTSMGIYMKANHPKAGTLTFSDGSTQAVTFKPFFLPQKVSFPAHATSSVRLTFGEVIAGKEFNDLCISEAHFLP